MHDSVTEPTRSQHHDSIGDEAHGAEYRLENVKNPLRQPPVCSHPKERLALPEHDDGVGTQNEPRTMKPEGSIGERSILWEEAKPVSQDAVGEEPVAYKEANQEPASRESTMRCVTPSREITQAWRGFPTMSSQATHCLPEWPRLPRQKERMRASSKVPTDDDPDQSRREADAVRRGITIDEHDPAMPNNKPSSDQCQTSPQASLAPDDIAAQVDLVQSFRWTIAEELLRLYCWVTLPAHGRTVRRGRALQTSAHENHMEDDPAGKTPPASPRPESCGPVTVAAPAEPHTAPLVPIRPTVTAPLGPLEAPSPSVEPYHTASIACPASTSPITQPVGAAVASLTSPTTNPSNVEASSSSFADAAAESPGPASPQPRSPPLSMHTVGSSEDLLVPPTCAKSEATPKSTSPMVDPLAASNEESISLSSNARSRLLHDDVSSATL
ncbi:hypothetical protein LTS02_017624 [Friedmanniomyces endolithicus]|nr:hypothetical protein LTS02_017624 [Friedmanniomyces endolithicus]